MKKFLKTLPLLAIIVLAMAGCLKDKGFEDNEYGIKNPDASPPAVGFANGKESRSSRAISADATPQTISFVINYTGAAAPTSDVVVNITVDNSIVTAYNTANGTNIVIPPAGSVTIPATVTIPAGQRFVTLDIVIPTAVVLNPNNQYGIGLRITGASDGVAIAGNLKQVLVAINIKNKYDGNYRMNGYHNRTPYTFPYINIPMDMVTSGPSSVLFYWVEAASVGHPIGTAPGAVSWYGPTVAPEVTFDPTTNVVTTVTNSDPAGPVITLFTGAGSFPSRYDPATKTIYVCWNYNNNPLRAFFDTLKYNSPR